MYPALQPSIWPGSRQLDREGKFAMGSALKCLCHVEGTDCMTARLLGGLPTLESHRARLH